MKFKVELAPDLVREILQRWPREDVDAFYLRLHSVREDPIGESEPIREPRLSRYMLRRFHFAGRAEKIAIFELNLARKRIRVLKCRSLRRQEGAIVEGSKKK
ncbi:MAG: hypothetical protein MI923_03785 [Phycisphaerales bacterium]|nr:hypothetical protein [Phycisphaerales bacterium]